MTSTHLHQNISHTSIASWKGLATAAVAAALGIIPAGVAATSTSTPAPIPLAAVVSHDIPRDHDNTMQQQRQHDRQRDQRQDRRAETTTANQILAGANSSTEM